MDQLPFYVAITSDGAELRARTEDGESVEATYASLREALDAVIGRDRFETSDAILRDGATGEAVGVWRWLDASATEDEPAGDGSQVTEGAIRSMAARLNDGSPIMLDGGSDDSDAHQSLSKTDTRANGWAHVACEVIDSGGRLHLYLYCELLPDIARDVAVGRLAYGSIGFAQSSADPDDATLLQHALTNIPAVAGLTPASAIRAAMRVRRVRFASGTRANSEERPMRKTTVRSELKKITAKYAKRGPAIEKLTQVCASLGVSIDDELSAESWDSPTDEALRAIKMLAQAEKVLEGLVAIDVEAASAVRTGRDADAADSTDPQQVDGFDDAAALQTWASWALGWLRDVFANANATPAELQDLATASTAAFQGAIGNATPPDDGGTGEGDMGEKDGAARARAEMVGLRAKVGTLETELAGLRVKTAEGEAREKRRAMIDHVDAAFRSAKVMIKPEDRDELVGDLLEIRDAPAEGETLSARQKRILQTALRAAVGAPPGGSVFGPPKQRSSNPLDGNKAVVRQAIADEQAKVRSEHPKWSDAEVFREATQRARRARPELFSVEN